MKTMKVALLATAALAAFSVSARADDTAAIKAQLEALTARIAQLEAAPAVPVGFSLLTVSEQDAIVAPGLERDPMLGNKATTFGILPTADAPASTTIQWSGYVRAAIQHISRDIDDEDDGSFSEDATHLRTRGLLFVVGTTDTAVGEVGAAMELLANFDSGDSETVYMDHAWGWWKMTPELTFSGGYNVSLANVDHGIRKLNDNYITRGDTAVDGDDWVQFRLSYESGPLGLAIAVEHTDEGDNDCLLGLDCGLEGSPFGIAAEATYAGDTFSAEVAGYIRDDSYDGDTESQIGVGVSMNLTEMFTLSASAGLGQNLDYTDADGGTEYDGDVIEGSVYLAAQLTEAVKAEVGFGMSNYDNGDSGDETDVWNLGGGLWWTPVDQLTMGAQASLTNREDDNDEVDELRAAFITYWRF